MARRRNPNLIYIPVVVGRQIVKNPRTLFPVDWEERVGEDNVKYDYEPIYDDKGNIVGTKRNVYVAHDKIKFIVRRRNKVKSNTKPLFVIDSERKDDDLINEYRK